MATRPDAHYVPDNLRELVDGLPIDAITLIRTSAGLHQPLDEQGGAEQGIFTKTTVSGLIGGSTRQYLLRNDTQRQGR